MLYYISCFIFGFFLPAFVAYDNCIQQSRFENIIIFGDSNSDTGNVFKLSNYTWPLSPPYYHGRFCNDRNWVDQLQVNGIKNYAYGSATTDNVQVQGYTKFNTLLVPGVNQQIDKYFNEYNSNIISSQKTLHIIWAGGNNVIFNPALPIPDIVNNLTNLVTKLCENNAKYVLIFNQVPAQYIPDALTIANASILAQMTAGFNYFITSNLHTIQQAHTQASIYIFDVYSLILKVITQNTGYFADTTNSCWNSVNATTVIENCQDPNKNVFLDNAHFTYTVQELIADVVRKFLLPSYEVNTASCYIQNA
ncbi:unnamed protein product [Adineta steineri]|uniref:Uncharacterized protein n=1 Tax=Adineta steineri TaxID=433720 RepID=A0A819MLR6_9BILA|nr:unnamed protein product [Adineta steineri]CAF3982469.1 unnamed protein product [Adineta steineri]